MKSLSFILFLFLTITIFSCGKSEQELKDEQEKTQREQRDSLKVKYHKEDEEAISALNKKYQAAVGWDTLEEYSFHFQEKFIEQKQLVSFSGEIKDVIKIDSSFIITIVTSSYFEEYVAKVQINSEMFNRMRTYLSNKSNTSDATFILKINKVKSLDLEIGSGSDSYGDENNMVDADNIETYVDENFTPRILFNSELVDFYFDKKVD